MYKYQVCRFGWWVLVLGTAAPGCQTVQLREGSLNQAASYGDLQERQVLDNLAKFVHDINSLPSFAYSAQGTNQVADTAGITSGTTWSRIAAGIYGWASSTANPSLSRQASQNWVLQPLNDPRKLELMRCAYQKVVRANLTARGLPDTDSSCPPCDGGCCPDCAKLANAFYTGNKNTAVPPPGDPKDPGRTTTNCLGTNPAWFAWGCKKDVPIHSRCLKVGHYCGTYVWVLPGGEDELAKLTMAILDYAVNAPASAAAPPPKQVTFYVDKNGVPTTAATATGIVTGTVPANLPANSLLRPELLERARQLESQSNELNMRMMSFAPDHPERAATQQTMTQMQNEAKTLRETASRLQELPNLPPPYRPSIDELQAPAANLLQLQLRLQATQPPLPPLP